MRVVRQIGWATGFVLGARGEKGRSGYRGWLAGGHLHMTCYVRGCVCRQTG